jgi:hypothetical protein
MQETDMSTFTPAQLRYHEAKYFYSQFIANSGPPYDDYFKMVCYFDTFLFSLVSVEEMIDESDRNRLLKIDVFRFVKALRNITMHHSVLAAPQPGAKFERPKEKVTLNAARFYLSKLENQAQPIFLESLLLEALAAVKTFVF